LWVTIFRGSTAIGIIALLVLLVNIANGAFGYAMIEFEVNPEELTEGEIAIEQLDKDALVQVLQDNVSSGLYRRLENDKPFAERDHENVHNLVIEWVVKPQVAYQWTLLDSLLNRSEIQREAEEEFPGLELRFVSWLDTEFITNPQSGDPIKAGVRTAILGSLWTMLIAFLFSFPVGVGAAIYLEEFARKDRWINRVIQTNINNLAGVPSIIYGILGLAIFVRALEVFTSGSIFNPGQLAGNGRTILSAGLTLGLLILPLIIINSQQAIRAVPDSLRQASFGLGATRWQTIWSHVLPSALPGILTGTILAVSRAIGETAPLVVVGASTFITVDPEGPFSKFTTLPIQIYQWTSRPQDVFRSIAAAAIIVLLLMLLGMNTAAVVLRNRFSKRI